MDNKSNQKILGGALFFTGSVMSLWAWYEVSKGKNQKHSIFINGAVGTIFMSIGSGMLLTSVMQDAIESKMIKKTN